MRKDKKNTSPKTDPTPEAVLPARCWTPKPLGFRQFHHFQRDTLRLSGFGRVRPGVTLIHKGKRRSTRASVTFCSVTSCTLAARAAT